ncbi:MAG: preprotein translocase subunit SecG, partial [Deltaproteobacteria bacterium]|nr:preprotein translocase subunit SecG [Deltaproteobacteria bacterium]
MDTAILVVHYIVCVFLIGVILLQMGKGAEVGAVFGASQTVFGSRGPATFFQKLTAVIALAFLATSLGLAQMAKRTETKSVVETAPAGEPAAPAAPEA